MRSDKNTKKKHKKEKGQQPQNADQIVVSADGAAIQPKKQKKHRKLKRVLLILFCLFLLAVIGVAIYVGTIIAKAPKIDTENIELLLAQSTVIYDDSGNEIDTVFDDENRSNVEYKDLPENLVNAFIALEDKTFWDHHGFNVVRILGAIKDSLTSGTISGTSTITQQLARNVYLKDRMTERTLDRKVLEAYYTVLLERHLSKEEIITAYLNTVYLGYHSYGVQAAAQSYFSKDVQDLTLEECAALAAIPQAPTDYQLVELVDNSLVSKKDENIIKRTSGGTFLVNDTAKDRRELCLDLMEEQGFITKDEHDKAIKKSLKKMLHPNYSATNATAAYFQDYVIDQVIEDLMEENEWDYDTAWEKVYHGGLHIYSTLDAQAQSVIEDEFSDDSNFPGTIVSYDGDGNIINRYGQISLYDFDDYFDDDGNFTFAADEITKWKDGSLVIHKNRRLNIYDTEVEGQPDYSLEFPNMYVIEDGSIYAISGGYINVPQQYKSKTKKGNLLISADFFADEDYAGFFTFNDDGTVTVTPKAYSLNQKVVQPQAAMTIVENSTGYIKAMVGGRRVSGRRLHNRAISPRQPGSSIKPLGVYSAALQQSAEEAANGVRHTFTDFGIDKQGADLWGNYLTPSSIVIDEKTVINGSVWPRNVGGYSGPQTMRSALQSSINTCAVKILMQVGVDYSIEHVKKFGLTTLVTEGETNDVNLAALALGGMTRGVTPLDMASAYTTFPNNGVRHETTPYTKVEDSHGKVILDKTTTETHQVLDPGVAWITADLLKSAVWGGTGSGASISGVQVGGKTGTTDDQFDIWFDGFTPSYSASLWIGNDQNFEMTDMSMFAASLWGQIMDQINGAKQGSYPDAPSNVTYSGGDYCIAGTGGGHVDIKKLEVKKKICKETGYLATPDCPSTEEKKFLNYGDDKKDKAPEYYCYKHNRDPEKYPVSPKEKYVPMEDPNEPEEQPTKPEEPNTPTEPVTPAEPTTPTEPTTPGSGEDKGTGSGTSG